MKTLETLHLLCGLLVLGWLSLEATAQLSQVNVAIDKNYTQIGNSSHPEPSTNVAYNDTDDTNCTKTSNNDLTKEMYHWWEVDLGRTYPVRDITVWAPSSYNENLYPFTITVDNQICVSVTFAPIYSSSNNSVRCTSVMYGRVVRLTLIKTHHTLKLCEFQIFVPSGVSKCKAGYHGAHCKQTCSDNCGGGPGKNFCYQDTGVCYDASGSRTGHSGGGVSLLLPLFLGVLLAFICPL